MLLLARETGLLRLDVVSIDGTKIDAGASKYRSDRIKALREQLAVDIAKLMEQAEHADVTDSDPQALPEELARRETLKAKLDEACARLEAEAARPAYEKKKAVYDAKTGRRNHPMRNRPLTDPDSRLMRRSDAHEFRQAYNAQAVVCAEGSQLIVTTGVVATSADAPSFASTVLSMEDITGLPKTVLADTGYASGRAVRELRKKASIRWSPSDGPAPAGLTTSGRLLKTGSHAGSPNPGDSPEGKAGNYRNRRCLQTTKTDRGAGLWNYQKHHGVQKIQSARSCKSHYRMDTRHSRIQLQKNGAASRSISRMSLDVISRKMSNPTGC